MALGSTQDPVDLRRAFSMFPSGVIGVCGLVGGEPVGMAVSSFTSVSLSPPLVSVCIARSSTTWPRLTGLGGLGVSVLGSGHRELCRRLSSRGTDRFDGASWESRDSGAVLLHGAALWLSCRIAERFPAGDHEIVLLEVTDSTLFPAIEPLIFHQSQLRALGLIADGR